MINRITPEVTIGALPDRLGSSGTANVPQIAASMTGIPIARTNRSQPSFCLQPQTPTDTNALISRINRMVRLIGCDPIFMNIYNDSQRFYITLLI